MTLEPRGPYGSQAGEIGPEPEHVRSNALGRNAQQHGERVPPQNVDLEMCVLGAIMLEPRSAYSVAADYVHRDSFYLDGHGIIFELMTDLSLQGIPPDSVAVLDALRARELIDKVGGSGVIMAMLNAVPTAANVEYHSRLVAEKWQQRQLIRGCTEVVEEVYKQERSLAEYFELAEKRILALGQRASGGTAQPLGDVVNAQHTRFVQLREASAFALANNQPLPSTSGFSFGLRDLDQRTGGIEAGMNVVVGALPSMMKTAFLCHMLLRLALDGVPCAFISLEMTAERIAERILCMLTWTGFTGIRTNDLRTPAYAAGLHDWQLRNIEQARKILERIPLYIVNAEANTPAKMKSQLRHLRSKHGVEVAGLDYIGLMQDDVSHGDNQVSMTTAVSRKNKACAQELKIGMVSLSQLSRATFGNVGKRPQLNNLRDSGAIEADADIVIFPWREYYHDRSRQPPYPDQEWLNDLCPPHERSLCKAQQVYDFWRFEEVEFDVAKNRDGDAGGQPVKALVVRALGRCFDLDREHGTPTTTSKLPPGETHHTTTPAARRQMNITPRPGEGD